MKLIRNISNKIDETLKSVIISKIGRKKSKVSFNDLIIKMGYVNSIITMLIIGFLVIKR